MSLKSITQLKELAAQKHYPITDKDVELMCGRGFLIPQSTDSFGNDLYDEYFIEDEKTFERILLQYNDTKAYYTPSEMYQLLVTRGITDVSEGAIERLAKGGYIDGYRINDRFLFNPDTLDNIEDIKRAFAEMERDEELAELEEDELSLINNDAEPDEELAQENDDEVKENDIGEEEFFEEDFAVDNDRKPKKKRVEHSKETTSRSDYHIDAPYENNSDYNDVMPPKDSSVDSLNNTVKTPEKEEHYDAFAKYNAEEAKRREERLRFEEEDRSRYESVPYTVDHSPSPETHAPLKDEQGHITFTGYNSGANEPAREKTPTDSDDYSSRPYQSSEERVDDFATKAKISEIATANVLSQSGINEIINYARSHSTEIKVPMKDGSYLQVESMSKTNDYTVSVVKPENDSAAVRKEVLYSSQPDDSRRDFAAITETYAESMGVDSLKSGYQDKEQETIDNKVLYAVGVVPQSQTFAPINGSESEKDYTSVVVPNNVEFVNPSIISEFERKGIKSFSTESGKVKLDEFNNAKVNENAIVASAYLGSDEHIAKELSKSEPATYISNAASESERKDFAEKVRVSEIAENTVLSETSINHIAEVVKSDGGRVDLPLQNGNLLAFEAVKNDEGKNDFKVTLYSPDDKDYSSPKSQLLYSSVTTEENAVKFGDVYSAYAAGMNVERLESYNKEPDKVADEKRVLYAIGAVTTNELLSATRGETFHAPKGVDCVSSSLIDKLQREGVASIDADRQTQTISEYRSKIANINTEVPESVYLGDYKNIERLTRKDEITDAFKERYNVRTENYYNGRKTKQEALGSLKTEESYTRKRDFSAAIATGVSTAVKTAVATGDIASLHIGNLTDTERDTSSAEKRLVNSILKNGMLSENGFYALVDAAENQNIELPLKNGGRISLEAVEQDDGGRSVQATLLNNKGEAKQLTENAALEGASLYSMYINANGNAPINEEKMLFALGAVPDGRINELISGETANVPKGISYVNPNIISKFEKFGAKKIVIGESRAVSFDDYKRAVDSALDRSILRKEKVNDGRLVSPKSTIITATQKGAADKTVLIPTEKGFRLSYMDGGHRVNVAVIGSLKDDATAFKPAQTFGIERQIAQANSRIMSAMPGVRTVTGEDGRVHIRLDADTVQQRHQATVLTNAQKEIIRLAEKQGNNSIFARSAMAVAHGNETLFDALNSPKTPADMYSAVLELTKEKNQDTAEQLKEDEKPVIEKGLRQKELEKNQNRIAASGMRSVVRQLGRMSGLTQSRDYFTTGAKALLGYNSPINVVGDLTMISQVKRRRFDFEEDLRRNLLVEDLQALGYGEFSGLSGHDSRRAAGIEIRRLNKSISASSKELFNGKDITRFSTYRMKQVLKQGKFDGEKLTAEQRKMLLAALKVKSHRISDMSAFNIADNLKRKNIVLPRSDYNLNKSKDVRALLRDLDDVSASVAFSKLLNGNRLSSLSTKQIKDLARNVGGNIPVQVQELAKAYTTGKMILKNKTEKKAAKRRSFSRSSIIVRRAFSSTEFMSGFNAVLLPVEYARLAKSYAQFTIALNKSIFYSVRRMYRATLQKIWRKTPLGKLNQKVYNKFTNNKFTNWRRTKKAERLREKAVKRTAKTSKRNAELQRMRNLRNKLGNKINKRVPGINKVNKKIGKVADKGKRFTSKLSNTFGRLKKIENIIAKPFRLLTAPFDALNRLKQKAIEKLLIPIVKWVAIALIAISLLEGSIAVVNLVLTNIQSTVWTQGETENEEDTQDDLDLDPRVSLTRDRVDLCLGLDSALKIYTEVMCDADSYDESWGETSNTAIKSVLESEKVKGELNNWFDPNANKYGNIVNLGHKINGIQTGIHYSYYDGDGNVVGLKSNAKDIMSVASSWMWENYQAKGLFKSYVEKLWNYSHAVAYEPREIYGNPDGKYLYRCDPTNPQEPCHGNVYTYRCNDSGATVYEKQGDGYVTKSVKVGNGETIEPYNVKGCNEHTVTYHGGKGAIYNAEASLRSQGCKSIGRVSVPYGTNGSKTVFYCKGCCDCTSKCSGTETTIVTEYHTGYSETPCSNSQIVGSGTSYHSKEEVNYYCLYSFYDTEQKCRDAGCTNPYYYPYVTLNGTTGWYGCGGHKKPFASCDNCYFNYSPFEPGYECYGHTKYYYGCKGHTITLTFNTCKGYCDGHSFHYCTGHVDLDISMVTLFLDDENGLTKLGMPKSVTTEIKTFKDKDDVEYQLEIQEPILPFVTLYNSVPAFQNIDATLPLPDSDAIKKEVKMKLEGIDNIEIASNLTVDTLRFFWMFKDGKSPYEDSNKDITTMDELVKQYFIQFETCKWQDTNDAGTLDASGVLTYGNFDIGHLAGVYKKFGKTNKFEGWYSYGDDGNIETVEKTEDGITSTMYVDAGSVGRAVAMMDDNWKELYDIDFPGSFEGTITDKDKALLISKAQELHGRGEMAEKILDRIGNDDYDSGPRGCVDYAESLYQSGFGKLPGWGHVPDSISDNDAVKWIYSNNNATPITSEEQVKGLSTGDCVLIGDEIYVVLYNNYNEISQITGKPKGITAEGRIVFATVAGGGASRLVAFNTETLTKQIGFGLVKY